MADDLSLIKEIKKSNDENCIKELIAKHSGIYSQIVNETISDQSNINKNDIMDDKNLFIYQKALKFDPSRNMKFSTYLGLEIKWKCLNMHNKAKNYEYCDVGNETEHLVDKDYIKEYIDFETVNLIYEMAEKNPDHRVRKIIQMRYKDCKSNKLTPWKKIAKKLKLSIQGTINIHNRFIKEIKSELKNY